MNRNQISEILFKKMNMVEPYPPYVIGIDKQCQFTAFFPGGHGIWKEFESEIIPSIMVLGHDFSTESKFNEMIDGLSNDIDSPTWRNMIKLFDESGICLEDCFFTNIFMGLRQTDSMVGTFPGFKDKSFVDRNIEFLKYQISLVKPRCIITLGKYSAEMLASTTEDLTVWRKWAALKSENIGLIKDVSIAQHRCNCVAIEHPSMRNSNVMRRKYKDFIGNEAEKVMLIEAIKQESK